VIEAIRRLVGPSLAVLDPAPAVARHLARVLRYRGLLQVAADVAPSHRFLTTADSAAFDQAAARLVGACCRSAALRWDPALQLQPA
jgi:glutamate racemase